MLVRVELRGEVRGEVEAPPSKSYSHRALFTALLAEGRSVVENAGRGIDDVEATIDVIEDFGGVVESPGMDLAVVHGRGRPAWSPAAYCRGSGTTLRIAMAVAALQEKPVVLHGDESLNRRPVGPLADALERLGARVITSPGGTPPVAVAGPMTGRSVWVDASISSQYATALLVAGSALGDAFEIDVVNPSSRPYLDITVRVLEAFGVEVERRGYEHFTVRGPPKPTRFRVPGDWSSAAPVAVLAAARGYAVIKGLDPEDPHPDRRLLQLLESAGVDARIVSDGYAGLEVHQATRLRAFTFDARDSPDLAPAAAALAAVACGESRILGASRLRVKESDRLGAALRLLRAVGVDAYYDEASDALVVDGACGEPPGASVLEPPADHRMVMMAALLLLLSRSRGGYIAHPDAVSKSYPGFWRDLARLGVKVEEAT